MVKEPRAGRVKTRLGRDIGMIRATWWFRHQLTALVREVQGPGWQTLLAVAPDRACGSRILPALPHVEQGTGDLGDRMARVFRRLAPGPVLIIGADIPGIRRAHIAQGFALLGRNDAVFGPAMDGGFWAIGLKRPGVLPKSLFEGVRWSSEHALSDTITGFPGANVALLPEMIDVDVASDFARISP